MAPSVASVLLQICLTVSVFSAQTRIDDDQPPMFNGKIKHVIAIMLENRSFDHLLGYQRLKRRNINGCLPHLGVNCSNPLDPSNPNSPLVYVGDEAVYIQPGGPDHSVPGTSLQTYNNYNDNSAYYYPAPMKGFVQSCASRDKFSELSRVCLDLILHCTMT